MNKRCASVGHLCVACGTCLKVCPFGAISIPDGTRARIDAHACVGCGKCSKICPASVIEIVSSEVCHADKEMV